MARAALVAGAAIVVRLASLASLRSNGGASYTEQQVLQAFALEGFVLRPLSPVQRDEGTGQVIVTPIANRPEGTFFFPPSGDFYVFVARSDDFATEFFEPLRQAGGGPGTFDRQQGNIVVSSDASLTATGLSMDQQRRIDAALDLFAES